MRQTHKNVEVIVVDDGSEDNTLEVAKSYAEKDSRLRVFHKENGGVSSARNMGIREAHGEYIIFLDSDDWLEDFAVEFLLDAQIKYPDKLIAFRAYAVTLDPEHKDVFYRKMYNGDLPSKSFESLEECIYSYYTSTFLCNSETKFFRTSVIQKYNLLFREDIHYGEDQVFNFDYLLKVKSMFFLSSALLNVVRRKDSAMNVSYNQRRTFVDGKFNDYAQVMIDSAYELDDLKVLKALKYHHTKHIFMELIDAFRSKGTEARKINIIRKKLKMYQREYMTSKRDSLIRKLDFLCGAYLPVPLARFTVLSLRYINDIVKSFRNRNQKPEVIPYW